jgi:hypothetical protein
MAADPKTALATFSLALGMDNVSAEESVQPAGQRPRLVRSRNVRLTKVPGMVSKAPGCTQIGSSLTGPCGGLVPHGKLDSSVMLLNTTSASSGSRRIAGSAVGRLKAFQEPSRPQNAFYPAQVTSAGQVPGSSRSIFNPAVCYRSDVGWTYFATIRALETGNYGVVLTVLADDGREVIAPIVIDNDPTADATSNTNFLGLTAHGSTVYYWSYGAGIVAATITISADLEVTVGAFASVYTPSGGSHWYRFTQLAYDPDDTANVYLACWNSASSLSAQVLRIATSNLAVQASVAVSGGGGAILSTSLSYLSGTGVLVGLSTSSGNHVEAELNSTTLATVWSQTTASVVAVSSCGWQHIDGALARVFAHSYTDASQHSTLVRIRDSAGASLGSFTLRYYTMIGQMVTQKLSASSVHAVITAQTNYDPVSATPYAPTDSDFLPDPSVELFRFTKTLTTAGTTVFVAAPVARVGTDMVIRYPGMLPTATTYISSSCSVLAVSSKILVTYLAENVEDGLTQVGYAPRYVWLDFADVQPDFAVTGAGQTVISGALPTVWDGNEITEFTSLRQPRLTGSDVFGLGPVLTSGTYSFVAIVSWKDSQGDTHRSAPSPALTYTGAALQPILSVAVPETLRNGYSQENFTVTIYATETDGTVAYAQEYRCTAGVAGDKDSVWTFNDIEQPVADAFHPAVYTDGSATQPLATYCPNACLDAEVVADRLWMLDAERPKRWWYSQPKESGVFFEMAPDLYIDVPANAGNGVATTHLNDRPLFLCERGIWTVYGEGPDALLNPPEFSAPTQMSDVACTQRRSVVKTPVGVMFVSNNRFVLFNGQQAQVFEEINATLHGNVMGTAVFRDQHEAVFFLADGYCYVFNWKEGVFTDWDTTVTGLSTITAAAQVPASGKVLIYGDEGELWLMDPDSASTTAQIDQMTGFMTFGGPQDDQVLANVALQAKREGAHGLSITTSTDYRSTVDSTKTYTAANVLAAVDDTAASKRYVLVFEPKVQQARAVQLRFTETGAAGEAYMPINCTIELRKNPPGKLAQAIRTSARK